MKGITRLDTAVMLDKAIEELDIISFRTLDTDVLKVVQNALQQAYELGVKKGKTS